MSKRYGRVLAAMVRGLTVPQHPWRRANTRLRAANALYQTHEVATRHGPIVFISTHPEALHYPRELVGREPETIDWITSEKARWGEPQEGARSAARGKTNADAAWFYPNPKSAAQQIQGHVAFWKGIKIQK